MAATTGIGTVAAIRATECVLDSVTVDHLVVVGIAGGIGPSIGIGDLVVPELVVGRPSGRRLRRAPLGATPPCATIVTSDGYSDDPDVVAELSSKGSSRSTWRPR